MFLTKRKIASAGTLVLAVLGGGAVGPSSPQVQPAGQAQPATRVREYPAGTARPTGILVLDNCDEQYQGKVAYQDNLTLLDVAGRKMFRVSGFNNCETIGSSHMIAADPTRKCIWVIENVAQRARRFDLTGKETLTIPHLRGSAIAIDRETGNVWALVGETIHGTTLVYDHTGKMVASCNAAGGYDLAYDPNAKAFWIAGTKLTKISAATGQVLFSAAITTWCASSIDVDPRGRAVWVAVRQHPQVPGSSNRLLKFDADGKPLLAIDLGQKSPFRLSVDGKDGSVWVAHFRKSVEHFSAQGKSEAEYALAALAVQVDPAGGDVWVITPTEVQKMTPQGNVTKRLSHASKTSQAWVAAMTLEKPLQARAVAGPVTAENLEQLWKQLGDDGDQAIEAIETLAGVPQQAMPFLRARLCAVQPAAAEKRIALLITQLEDEDDSVRDKARSELEKLGPEALPQLRPALFKARFLKVRHRLERLVEELETAPLTAEQKRLQRALQVLELAATAEARQFLNEVAKGSAGAWLAPDAEASLKRLQKTND